MKLTLPHIRTVLAAHQPRLVSAADFPSHRHAAVALLLHDAAPTPEVLYLRRAKVSGDPWSGDIGFPGGHIDPDDTSPQAAAIRETREEIGLDLSTAEPLGRLDDIAGAHLPIIVSCFAFHLPAMPKLNLNSEVSAARWFPLDHLLDPAHHVSTVVNFRGESFSRPAINLFGPGERVLWGITYRLTVQFLRLAGEELPDTPIP